MKHLMHSVTIATIALTTLAGCGTPVAPAVPSATDLLRRTITVVGEGSASAKPDVARASIGVEITAATVADATRMIEPG